MGRKAGISPEQTKADLLTAAAAVFARKGYDGASISDICREANLSSGAVYAHYAGKAELFVEVVKQHGRRQLSALTGVDLGDVAHPIGRVPDVAGFFETAGAAFRSAETTGDSSLILESIMASRRHPEVAALLASWVEASEDAMAGALRRGVEAGVISNRFDPEAISRFVLMVALGARLVAALDLPAAESAAWSKLIEGLVGVVRAEPQAASPS